MRSKRDLDAAIRQRRRAALVVNTRSRRGQRLYHSVHARLTDAGFNRGYTPTRITLAPNALRVMVPADFPDA